MPSTELTRDSGWTHLYQSAQVQLTLSARALKSQPCHPSGPPGPAAPPAAAEGAAAGHPDADSAPPSAAPTAAGAAADAAIAASSAAGAAEGRAGGGGAEARGGRGQTGGRPDVRQQGAHDTGQAGESSSFSGANPSVLPPHPDVSCRGPCLLQHCCHAISSRLKFWAWMRRMLPPCSWALGHKHFYSQFS